MADVSKLWIWSKSTASRAAVRCIWIAVMSLAMMAMLLAVVTGAQPDLGAVLGIPVAVGLVRNRAWAFEWIRFVNMFLLAFLPVALLVHFGWPHLTTVNFFGWRLTDLGRSSFAMALVPVAFLAVWTTRAFGDASVKASRPEHTK